MRKSNILLALSALVLTTLSSCSSKETLLILNWGEYINEDVVEAFEKEYNCDVSVSIADSNELFYSKVRSGTTAYDLVVPSDYMVEKMVDKDMLEELDFTKISNYSRDAFLPGVQGIMSEMEKINSKYINYFVPYFWGTFGLMYNKRVDGLETLVQENSWQGYFDPNIIPDTVRVGMYNVPRDAYAATMFYNHLSPNEINDDLLTTASNTLKMRSFTSWGTDTLKKGVQAGNLDLAFVYTGDFLDMLYEVVSTKEDLENLDFDIYIPDETIAFMDNLVMPKNARHQDLAYKFMNFMLEEENAYNNASVVGYCTPLKSSYEKIVEGIDSDDEWLQVWGTVNKKYYPILDGEKTYQGTPLKYFDKDDLTKVTNLVNNVKVG